MAANVGGRISLRALREDDLPALFAIQLDETARHMAAFTDEASRDRDAYLQKSPKILADDAITNRVVEIDGAIVGSVAAYPLEGHIEVTYWIRRDWWGRGVATAALAALLGEVTVRPIRARVAGDNHGSIRVLEKSGFVRVGSEDAFSAARQATVTELIFKLSD